jgi:hypothetical protein
MHERKVARDDKHQQSIDSVTKTWALWAGICTSPLFILFAYFGDPGRGQAAWVCALAVAVAVRFLWDLRTHAWFWITVAVTVLLHIPLIALIPWPLKQLTYVALLPAGFADFAIVYGVLRLIENMIDRSDSGEQTVQ